MPPGRLLVSVVYQIAAVNPVTGGRARRRKTMPGIAGGKAGQIGNGGSLIAASNDGGRGVCSSLEVSKNFKFSYSSRARVLPRLGIACLLVVEGLRMLRIDGRMNQRLWQSW